MHRLNRHMGKFFKSHFLQCLVNGIRFFPFAGQPFPHEHGRKGPTHRHIRKSLTDLRIETPERRLPLRTARTKRCKKDASFHRYSVQKVVPSFFTLHDKWIKRTALQRALTRFNAAGTLSALYIYGENP